MRCVLLALLAACGSTAAGGGGGGGDDVATIDARGSGSGGGGGTTDVFASSTTKVVVEIDYETGQQPFTGGQSVKQKKVIGMYVPGARPCGTAVGDPYRLNDAVAFPFGEVFGKPRIASANKMVLDVSGSPHTKCA